MIIVWNFNRKNLKKSSNLCFKSSRNFIFSQELISPQSFHINPIPQSWVKGSFFIYFQQLNKTFVFIKFVNEIVKRVKRRNYFGKRRRTFQFCLNMVLVIPFSCTLINIFTITISVSKILCFAFFFFLSYALQQQHGWNNENATEPWKTKTMTEVWWLWKLLNFRPFPKLFFFNETFFVRSRTHVERRKLFSFWG